MKHYYKDVDNSQNDMRMWSYISILLLICIIVLAGMFVLEYQDKAKQIQKIEEAE